MPSNPTQTPEIRTLNADGWRLFATRCIRLFAYGFLSVAPGGVLFWGGLGMGADSARDAPSLGPVHNAAGYLLSEMIGCRVEYRADAPPRVIPALRPDLRIGQYKNVGL